MRRPDDVRPGQPARSELSPAGRRSLGRTLSKLGVCSRREAERWIAAGRVTVNGRVARSPRPPVDPARDVVLVDGLRVVGLERVVIALHKPVGLLTTRVDPAGRPTVYDCLRDLDRWVFPVGRLDRDTSGLLLFTNDTAFAHRLTDPERHAPRTYHARVRGRPDPETLQMLAGGVNLGRGVVTRPATVRLLEASGPPAEGAWLEIVLTEGRKRQIRRMCAILRHPVQELIRLRIGPFALGPLPPGHWRDEKGSGLECSIVSSGRSFPRSDATNGT
ncbi:MAG: rRNA pseudouridine synthase [Acidobacteria bacterium]|nr:rRNA pseudouridine synthase [Acidobacteriota bacterium]